MATAMPPTARKPMNQASCIRAQAVMTGATAAQGRGTGEDEVRCRPIRGKQRRATMSEGARGG